MPNSRTPELTDAERLRLALEDPVSENSDNSPSAMNKDWRNVIGDVANEIANEPIGNTNILGSSGDKLILGSLAGQTRTNKIPNIVYNTPNSPPGYSNARYTSDIKIVGTDTIAEEMIHPRQDSNPPPPEYFKEPEKHEEPLISTKESLIDSHDKARTSVTAELTGFCFPECTNSEITARLDSLMPKITITKYNTGTFPALFQNFINGLRTLQMNSIGHDENEDDTLTSLFNLLFKGESEGLPPSIKLLFCSLPLKPDCKIYLPITSSPLSINSQLDHGWKANQSIFDFIKKQLGGSGFSSTFGKLFGGNGESVLKFGTDAADLTENLMHIFGRDIQLGPYWSIGEGALDNRQSLSFNTILVNDSKTHYEENAKVLRKLFIESQPYAIKDENSSYAINPPSVFDVELNTCTAGKKKYFLCTGQFNCEPKGRYYNKIPEAYSLSLTFNSLIPDLLRIQMEKGGYSNG